MDGKRNASGPTLSDCNALIVYFLRRYSFRDDWEDLLQEARLIVWLKLTDFDPNRAAFATWVKWKLRGVVSRYFSRMDGRRTHYDEVSLYSEVGDDGLLLVDIIADQRESTDLPVLDRLERAAAMRVISSPRYRRALALRLDGATLQEIGEALGGISRERARQILAAVKEDLKDARLL